MREILFRGKREKTSEWVEGYLVIRDKPFLHDIVVPVGNSSQVTYAVIRETVGQYTGLKDSTGKRIFEGDILEFWQPEFDLSDKCWGIVRYFADKDYPAFDVETLNVDSNGLSYIMANCECYSIGNIHDNDLKSNA